MSVLVPSPNRTDDVECPAERGLSDCACVVLFKYQMTADEMPQLAWRFKQGYSCLSAKQLTERSGAAVPCFARSCITRCFGV